MCFLEVTVDNLEDPSEDRRRTDMIGYVIDSTGVVTETTTVLFLEFEAGANTAQVVTYVSADVRGKTVVLVWTRAWGERFQRPLVFGHPSPLLWSPDPQRALGGLRPGRSQSCNRIPQGRTGV